MLRPGRLHARSLKRAGGRSIVQPPIRADAIPRGRIHVSKMKPPRASCSCFVEYSPGIYVHGFGSGAAVEPPPPLTYAYAIIFCCCCFRVLRAGTSHPRNNLLVDNPPPRSASPLENLPRCQRENASFLLRSSNPTHDGNAGRIFVD